MRVRSWRAWTGFQQPPEALLSSRVAVIQNPRAFPALRGFFYLLEHMPKDVILTADGLVKLKDELQYLQGEKRREVALRIKEAREFGDITENSEYDDAKNEQAMLESKIAQVEDRLRSATVIDAKDVSTELVQVGSIVNVKDEKTGKGQKFTIVGSPEAKPPERLSNESPVGKALLGHRRNDIVDVPLPNGKKIKLKITKIDVGL